MTPQQWLNMVQSRGTARINEKPIDPAWSPRWSMGKDARDGRLTPQSPARRVKQDRKP